MKLELCDGQSNHSDFSGDSQSSMESSSNSIITTRSSLTVASLDGLNSGIPTRTTSTLTPTHLRNIEQTFIELQNTSEPPNHAGFVPPPVATPANGYGIMNQHMYEENSHLMLPLHVSPGPSSCGDSSSSPGSIQATPRRRTGGRRPNKSEHNLTPEEEQRRMLRRIRNKEAAARCRKRRMDHTNELEKETEGLEKKKHDLQQEVEKLKRDCHELELILTTHNRECRLGINPPSPPDVKPFTEIKVKIETDDCDDNPFNAPEISNKIMLSQAIDSPYNTIGQMVTAQQHQQPSTTRTNRPSTLPLLCTVNPAQTHHAKNNTNIAGIDISTPSQGMYNFESLMNGGTGLTPVQPCATQQRHDGMTDTRNNKLVPL